MIYGLRSICDGVCALACSSMLAFSKISSYCLSSSDPDHFLFSETSSMLTSVLSIISATTLSSKLQSPFFLSISKYQTLYQASGIVETEKCYTLHTVKAVSDSFPQGTFFVCTPVCITGTAKQLCQCPNIRDHISSRSLHRTNFLFSCSYLDNIFQIPL